MSPWNGLYEGQVQEGGGGRNVGAQLVLAVCKVNPRLGPNAGVDVGEQRGRHSDVRGASPVERGGQANDVEAHPSADGDEGLRAAVQGEVVDLLQDLQDHFHGLVLLGGGQRQYLVQDIVGPHILRQLGAVDVVDLLVNDYEAFDWLVAHFNVVQLLRVSDVTQQEGFVHGVQQVLRLRDLVGEDYWADDRPRASRFCDALIAATLRRIEKYCYL